VACVCGLCGHDGGTLASAARPYWDLNPVYLKQMALRVAEDGTEEVPPTRRRGPQNAALFYFLF